MTPKEGADLWNYEPLRLEISRLEEMVWRDLLVDRQALADETIQCI